MRIGLAVLIVSSFVLAACAGGDSRTAGSALNPLCAPDGSVVYTQYANSAGSFDGVKASTENCPWNKK